MAARTSSLVHPKYKTKYAVTDSGMTNGSADDREPAESRASHPRYSSIRDAGVSKNWPEYEQGLRSRGDVTIWFNDDAIARWIPRGRRKRGAQRHYSDLAIETALTLRLLFHLPLRQTEGFVASLLRLMELDLRSPDHTTLSRRAKQLEIELPDLGKGSSIHLVVDSTGLQIVGNGPWAAAKHGGAGTREWRKLHVGVDQHGVIIAEKITDSSVDDASVVPDLVDQIPDGKCITRFTADGAYDQSTIYETFADYGATVVVPPVKTANSSRKRTRAARARNRTVNRVRKVGRRKWKKEARYHRQARVENTFFRFKQVIGG